MDEVKVPIDIPPVPTESFDTFYKRYTTVEDITKSQEWKDVFSYYFEFEPYELDILIGETKEEMEAYTPEQRVQEIIRCADSFAYFCHKYVKIIHPMFGLIPFCLYKFQKRVVSSYTRHRFNILSKFRQGGLTTTSVVWALWRCMFSLDQKIMVLSKTDREAIASGEVARVALEHLPQWMQPAMSGDSKHEKQFNDTNSTLWFYTPEAARGKSATVLIIDEAAFIPDMETYWKAMYPTIATGGACCVVSTVNGMGNWYEEQYHKAAEGENEFKVIDLDYWEHPDYNNPKWVKQMQKNLGPKGWQQEVLRSFLKSGETFISPEIINQLNNITKANTPTRVLFENWHNNTKERAVEWDSGALWLWKEPVDGHEYIIGVDCAEGMGENGDNSCFQILDQNTLEQVAEFYSNSIPPHVFAKILHQIGIYYNSALLIIESMNQGVAVISDLENELAYENLYYEYHGKQQTAGVKTHKINRPVWLEALQNKMLNGTIKINSIRFVNELKTFVYNPRSKKAEAHRGKHDDAVMAMAIALYVRETQMRGIPVGAEVPEEMMAVFKTEMYEEIKKEIMRDAPEDWITLETHDHIFEPDEDDVLPGITFDLKRPNDKLLKEFGW